MDGSLITALFYSKILSTRARRTNISSPGPLCFLLPLPPLTLTQPSLMQAPQTVKCAMKTESNTMLGFLGRRVLWPLGLLIFISALFTLQRRHFTDGPSIAHSRSSDKSDSLKHVSNSTLGVSGDAAAVLFPCHLFWTICLSGAVLANGQSDHGELGVPRHTCCRHAIPYRSSRRHDTRRGPLRA